MRVILTSLGQETVKILNSDLVNNYNIIPQLHRNKSVDAKTMRTGIEHTKQNSSQLYASPVGRNTTMAVVRGSSSIRKNSVEHTLSELGTNLTLNSPSRQVNLKMKKLNIPKNFSDKYASSSTDEYPSSKGSFILPVLPDKLFSTEQTGELPKSLSLRTILGEDNISNLKKQMKRNKYYKDKDFVMSPKELRRKVDEKSPYKLLDEELATEIDTNQINLIKYLSSEKSFSEKTIKRLSNISEQRKVRLNKLCQIAEHDEEDLQLILGRIRTKVEGKIDIIKEDFKRDLDLLEEEKQLEKRIISQYKTHQLDKEMIYHDQLNEINKHWKKLHLSRYYFNHKNTLRNNSVKTGFNKNDNLFS